MCRADLTRAPVHYATTVLAFIQASGSCWLLSLCPPSVVFFFFFFLMLPPPRPPSQSHRAERNAWPGRLPLTLGRHQIDFQCASRLLPECRSEVTMERVLLSHQNGTFSPTWCLNKVSSVINEFLPFWYFCKGKNMSVFFHICRHPSEIRFVHLHAWNLWMWDGDDSVWIWKKKLSVKIGYRLK